MFSFKMVKTDNNRFLFPDEWKAFLKDIKKRNNKLLYEIQFHTGARFDEAIHLRPMDFDFERGNVRLWKTKVKAKKGEKVGKPRTISISPEFLKKVKKFCKGKPRDKFLFNVSIAGYNQLLKRSLARIEVNGSKVEAPKEYSSHNIRKTHGMYLKALGIDVGEICTRLGHDVDTYIQHYGSADVFSEKDMRGIRDLLGSLYQRQRRF